MALVPLDFVLINNGKPNQFVKHLNALREDHSELDICNSLLAAVAQEKISPSPALAPFVAWCQSLEITIVWLNHPLSSTVRQFAIKNFGKALRNPRKWAALWKSAGDTQGIVDYLARVSVSEIKLFAQAISASRRGQRIPAREKCIEELLQALIPTHYAESTIRSHDKRPVQEYYACIVKACSSEFVNSLLDAQDLSNPLYKGVQSLDLLKSHSGLLLKRVTDAIIKNGKRDLNFRESFKAFCYRYPTTRGPFPKVSAPMAFSMRMLRLRVESKDAIAWPEGVHEGKIYSNLLRKCMKRNLRPDMLRDVFILGLDLLKISSMGMKLTFPSDILFRELYDRWCKVPAEYESLLIYAITLNLGDSAKSICQTVVSKAKQARLTPHQIWDLLSLHLMHAPKKKNYEIANLESTTDLSSLEKQSWSTELFYMLEKEKAIRLLESLQKSFPQDNFLLAPGGISILNMPFNARQGSIVLLLTLLRQGSSDASNKVRTTVDENRRRAATSREQMDRASLAIAAIKHSIASGSLEMYGDTVAWLQRFTRDPLTSKEVFGRNIVLTTEGIDLLSGIPDPIPETMTLQEISANVRKADAILMSFHETMLIAKREPSYQVYDWNGVSELFGKAIEQRTVRIIPAQQRLHKSNAETYAAIWHDTLAMLETVDTKFLQQAIQPIRAVLFRLPATTLAVVAKDMLAKGAERRKQKVRQPGDDILESLSYSVLLQVVNGDRPDLAQQLVLETILDRPDASSWHRQFLSSGFLMSLTAKQAQDMLLAFASAIGEKLEEQSYVQINKVTSTLEAPAPPSVKVTTVKYLAQLLDNAAFIPADTAIDVLVELFKAATHRDVRLATLESLLSLLNILCNVSDENWRLNPNIEKIMNALESVVPVIGSINERRPLREVEWAEAEATGNLPDVSEKDNMPPLMSAVFDAFDPDTAIYPGLLKMQEESVSRLLLPIYYLSKQEQSRWNKLFLKVHKSALQAKELSSAPVAPYIWKLLLQDHPNFIPSSVLDDFNDYIIMTISQPPLLKSLNTKLKNDPELRDTPKVAHWLSIFNTRMSTYSAGQRVDGNGTETMVDLILHHDLRSEVSDGITYAQIQRAILNLASLFLDLYDRKPSLWSDFTKALRPPCVSVSHISSDEQASRSMTQRWQRYQSFGRPILEKSLELLQARKLLYKRQENLAILPSTDLLNHWLLPFGPIVKSKADRVNQCKFLVSALETNLSNSLAGEANVLRWPRILTTALTISDLITSEERLLVAVLIGRLGNQTNQKSLGLNFVKMGLAMKLIENGGLLNDRKVGETDWEGLRATIWRWVGYEDESIRERAVEWKSENQALWKKIEKGDQTGK